MHKRKNRGPKPQEAARVQTSSPTHFLVRISTSRSLHGEGPSIYIRKVTLENDAMAKDVHKWNKLNSYPTPSLSKDWEPGRSYATAARAGPKQTPSATPIGITRTAANGYAPSRSDTNLEKGTAPDVEHRPILHTRSRGFDVTSNMNTKNPTPVQPTKQAADRNIHENKEVNNRVHGSPRQGRLECTIYPTGSDGEMDTEWITVEHPRASKSCCTTKDKEDLTPFIGIKRF